MVLLGSKLSNTHLKLCCNNCCFSFSVACDLKNFGSPDTTYFFLSLLESLAFVSSGKVLPYHKPTKTPAKTEVNRSHIKCMV